MRASSSFQMKVDNSVLTMMLKEHEEYSLRETSNEEEMSMTNLRMN